MIVAATLTNVAPDREHLPELVAEVRALRAAVERPDEEPTTVSADAGYFSGDNAAEDGRGIDLLIAAGRDDPAAAASGAGGVFAADRFGYETARDVWICPAGKLLRLPGATGARGNGCAGPPDQEPLGGRPGRLPRLPPARTLPEAGRAAPAAGGEGPARNRRAAPQAGPAGGATALCPAQVDRGAGLRPVQGEPGLRRPLPARPRARNRRVPAGLSGSQSRQAATRQCLAGGQGRGHPRWRSREAASLRAGARSSARRAKGGASAPAARDERLHRI